MSEPRALPTAERRCLAGAFADAAGPTPSVDEGRVSSLEKLRREYDVCLALLVLSMSPRSLVFYRSESM